MCVCSCYICACLCVCLCLLMLQSTLTTMLQRAVTTIWHCLRIWHWALQVHFLVPPIQEPWAHWEANCCGHSWQLLQIWASVIGVEGRGPSVLAVPHSWCPPQWGGDTAQRPAEQIQGLTGKAVTLSLLWTQWTRLTVLWTQCTYVCMFVAWDFWTLLFAFNHFLAWCFSLIMLCLSANYVWEVYSFIRLATPVNVCWVYCGTDE